MRQQMKLTFSAGRDALAWELSEKFRQYRLKKGWTQAHVATKVGATASAIAKLENFRSLSGQYGSFPSIDLTCRVCELYGYTPEAMALTIDNMRQLRRLNGKPGEMKNKAGIGRKVGARSENLYVVYPGTKHQPREVNQFPDLEEEYPEYFIKPGLSKDVLAMALVWSAVVVLAFVMFFFVI